MTYKVNIIGIKWDSDENLPKNHEFEISKEFLEDRFGEIESKEDLEDLISEYTQDYLSDKFGYYHDGWKDTKIEEIESLSIDR